MFLACDIGNTNIKSAFFRDDKISGFNSFKDTDSFLKYLGDKKFESAGISSVVPSINAVISKGIKKISGVKPYIIDKNSPFSINLNYQTLGTLGIDRICSAEGAYRLIQKKSPGFIIKNNYVLVIDFGTATTVNILKMPAEFIGGIILPGIEIMFGSLNKNTAQLPAAGEKDYKGIIGKSTKSSIASGIVSANAGIIERLQNYLKKNEKAGEIKIYITGGNAKKIVHHLDFEFVYERALVLMGVNAVCRKLKN
jgi:type III pantothenate kinase